MPFIVTNGNDTKFRGWGETGPIWVDNIEDAVQYARRKDAERVHAEDEDAWHIREHYEGVLTLAGATYRPLLVENGWHLARYAGYKIDALVDFEQLGLGESQNRIAATICAAALNRSNVHLGGLREHVEKVLAEMVERFAGPFPLAVSNPSNSTLDALHLLQEFCIKNATQWKLGAGDHHHPIWAMVSESLNGRTPITEGPQWPFIQPENRLTLTEIINAKAAAAEQ